MRFSVRGRETSDGVAAPAGAVNGQRPGTPPPQLDAARSPLNRPELIEAKLRLHRRLIDEINLASSRRVAASTT